MSKTVISLLIWLVCMPCMAAAETSKELEDALEKAKKEVSALFDANETEAYINSNRKLMELCLEANDEDLYYKTWSNLATFTFRQNAQKGLKVADEMRDYAKEHDSKIGIITALYTQANMSLKVGMNDRAVKLCNQAIDYKNQYLPKVNITHIYWMLAKIHLVKHQRKEALDALNRCQQEPGLTPYQHMNILAYQCEAAFCKEPAEICTRMNDALSGDDNENGMFVTFWLGLVDLQTGRLDYCNAGHNPPIIGGGDNHGEFLEMLPNAPIGLWPGLVYKGEKIDTIKNRPLFIYTDGLNEAENPQQEQFGDERLLAALQRTTFENARQTINSLKQEVEAFRGDAEPNDDLTMMCINVS